MQDVIRHGDVAYAWVILLCSGKQHKIRGTGRENWGHNHSSMELPPTCLTPLVWATMGSRHRGKNRKRVLNVETFIAFKTKISWICLNSNSSDQWIQSFENKPVVLCLLRCSKVWGVSGKRNTYFLQKWTAKSGKESQILQFGRCPTILSWHPD